MSNKRKSLREFVAEHRYELDIHIARTIGRDKNPYATDSERRGWVLNDESLYNWAKSEGIRI